MASVFCEDHPGSGAELRTTLFSEKIRTRVKYRCAQQIAIFVVLQKGRRCKQSGDTFPSLPQILFPSGHVAEVEIDSDTKWLRFNFIPLQTELGNSKYKGLCGNFDGFSGDDNRKDNGQLANTQADLWDSFS